MKKLLIATALATSLTTVSVQASPSIVQDDINQIFSIGSTGGNFPVGGSKQSHQVAMLSNREMKETEGDWWPVVYYAGGGIVGAVGGGYSYVSLTAMASSHGTSVGSWGGFWGSVAGGAIGGVASPATSWGAGILSGGLGAYGSTYDAYGWSW